MDFCLEIWKDVLKDNKFNNKDNGRFKIKLHQNI
jgi:hypothetical protein